MSDESENVDLVDVIRKQMIEIDKLRAENKRLVSEADAHTTLKSIYTNPESPEANRIKAAAAALPIERPRLTAVTYYKQPDRKEAWRSFERWRLRREIVLETRNPPQPGWDAHLVGDTYQPPDGDAMPPVDVESGPSGGFAVHTNLLPGLSERRTGNGNGEDEPQAD